MSRDHSPHSGDYAIDVQGLSKRYYKAVASESLMSRSVWQAAALPLRLLLGGTENGPTTKEPFWALQNIDFQVAPGESLAIIGPNGAGKSTLLRVLARITPPTEGIVRMRGRVTPLLGVGTGFVPSLTGRANIYLNGSILGMSRGEIRNRFDDIVDFAGVREFIDMPVKHYSSGMYARLAFSVAAHIVTDVLLVDEVLSVGDAAFSRKSMQKMVDLMGSGRTVVFVSHSMDAVMQFCQKALWMDRGRVVMYGPADEVAAAYLASVTELKQAWSNPALDRPASAPKPPSRSLDIVAAQAISVELLDHADGPKAIFMRDDEIRVRLRYRIVDDRLPVVPVLHVHSGPRHGMESEVHVFTAWDPDALALRPPGEYVSSVSIPGMLLNDGDYFFSVALVSPGPKVLRHFREWRLLACKVIDVRDPGRHLGNDTRGVVRPELAWTSTPVTADQARRTADQLVVG
jgi:lipopolysaccharide transport system ATP-binding protein